MRSFTKFRVIKEDEMHGARSTDGRDEKFIQDYGRKTRREETTWLDLGINGKILESVLGK
jgi:hypothetical protein